MRISQLEIKNFRAIEYFSGNIDDLTVFIGPNGGGKSSILHAINWLFDGKVRDDDDFFKHPANGVADEMSVTITFEGLTPSDRQAFGKYARGEQMVLKRRQRRGDGKSTLWGAPSVAHELDAVRDLGVADLRKRLSELVASEQKFSNLIDREQIGQRNKKELLAVIDQWEANPANRAYLKEREREDATEFFGVVGSDKLAKSVGFIFVPAAQDLTAQFDISNKNSAIELLLGAVVKRVIGSSIKDWAHDNEAVLTDLQTRVQDAAETELQHRSQTINHHLSRYLPGAELTLSVGLDEWEPKTTPVAKSVLSRHDLEWPLAKQGHGVQRATLLAVLQGLAEMSMEEAEDGGNDFIVCIEEPEVYQHPVQARTMASAFHKAAKSGQMQFIFATHSPYFVDGEYLESTFRVVPTSGGSRVHQANRSEYFKLKDKDGALGKYYSKPIIEGLFSRTCLLVEGETDKAVFETLRDRDTGMTLAERGITVVDAEGADNLLTVAALLKSYGVPSYIVRDGDGDQDDARKTAKSRAKSSEDEENEFRKIIGSRKGKLNKFISDASQFTDDAGLGTYRWGTGEYVGKDCAILSHDIERELENWQEFMRGAEPWLSGDDLRKTKRAGSYARVLEECPSETAPEVLGKIVDAVNQLADRQLV